MTMQTISQNISNVKLRQLDNSVRNNGFERIPFKIFLTFKFHLIISFQELITLYSSKYCSFWLNLIQIFL